MFNLKSFSCGFLLLLFFVLLAESSYTQNGTFITLNSGGSFTRVTIGASGCSSTPLNLCNNFNGNNPLSIALDSNILYVVDNRGFLYKNILTPIGTIGGCTGLGQFANNSQGYFGLTVGPNGIVYTAFGSDIEIYNPTTNTFSVLGTLPNGWRIGGDLLFYQGRLFEAVTNGGLNSLIEVNLNNIASSSLYMNFNSGSNVFGFASVTQNCALNQTYAISNNGSSTDIYTVDMTNKTQASTITCNLPFRVNDAASVAETKSDINIKLDTLNLSSCASIIYNSKAYLSSTTLSDTLKSDRGCDSIYTFIKINISNNAIKDTFLRLSSCNQIVYKNIVYTSSTTIIDTTIKTIDGLCDSIYRFVQLSINKVLESPNTLNFFDCSSVLYNGIYYTKSTILKDTLKSALGCDSIYTVTNINIAQPTFRDTLILHNCKVVTYKNISYTSSILFYDTIKTSNQLCDSIIRQVIITIKPLVVQTTVQDLSDCKQVIYNGNIYSSSTILRDTFRTILGCDSAIKIITITILGAPTTMLGNNLGGCDSVVFKGITYFTNNTFIDTIKNSFGCDSIYLFNRLLIYPKPTVKSNSIFYKLANTSINLTPIYTDDFAYQWTPKLYLSSDSVKYPICTANKNINYTVKVNNSYGCLDSALVNVVVSEALEIPTAFSPNGDAINDTWEIKNINSYPKNVVIVFDRFGQKLFQSSAGNYKAWNGIINNNQVPTGVYYYIINLGNGTSILKGYITILR
jgi:gliding motility-associated-like protein